MATIMGSSIIIKTMLNNERFARDILKQSTRRNIQQRRKARGTQNRSYECVSSMLHLQNEATFSCRERMCENSELTFDKDSISKHHQVGLYCPFHSNLSQNHFLRDKCFLPGGWIIFRETFDPFKVFWTGPNQSITVRSFVTSGKCFDNGKAPPHSATVGPWDAVKEKKEKFREAKQDLIEDIRETKAKVKEQMDAIIERENIWTIPNLLCISRIACSPLLCYYVVCADYKLALGLFMFAGFTDLLDGWIARTFPSQASRLGSFLDPLADKILVAMLFLSLTYVGLIPLPLTGIIIYRDVLIIAGASYVRYKSLPPPKTIARYFDATHATAQLAPTTLSKINTAVQLGLITASLAAPVFAYSDHYLLKGLWWVTAATTMASGISYIFSKDTYKILKKMKTS
ncbi:cardiolipin synthase [Halocaridina rubra]|uniref:cardiolipin synthase (CMP-forming) n=1 Tax=Halocaridina rubra TaxID=373956 RepID=A0AAN9AGW6_HALRR